MSPGATRDPASTQRRLLEAGRDEFAAVGIAGARVDRIAAAARSNKAQIYHYFDSKDGLFDAVFDQMCRETVNEVPIDPANLPEYAGRLHDSYRSRPWVQRLATWHRLERGADAALEVVIASNTAKMASVATAQQDGLLPTTFTAAELLGLVIHLAGFWESNVGEYDVLVADIGVSRRRAVVVASVAAVVSTR